MFPSIHRVIWGLSAFIMSNAAMAADPNISYSFTGPQASDYQFVDSGWRTVQGSEIYRSVEFGTSYQNVYQYTDQTGAVHEVTQTGYDMIGYETSYSFSQYSRSLSLSILPSHQGRFEVQFQIDTEIGGNFYSVGDFKSNDAFLEDLIAGTWRRPLEWSAQFQAPADSTLHEVMDDFERQMDQDNNVWIFQISPLKPGLNTFSLSLPATASFYSFGLDFIANKEYGLGTRIETDKNFLVTSQEDRVIMAAVPEPETWVQLAACMAVLMGVGHVQRKSKAGRTSR